MKKKLISAPNEVKRIGEELRKEREKSTEYLNRLMYLQADFENYRKRIEKDLSEVVQLSKEKLIVNLLSVIDELELALRSGRETENKQALLEGVEMSLKKLYIALEREGLVKIDAVGKSFNPEMHEVVMKVPTRKHDEGVIIEEVRKGFKLKDKVIRPTVVKIASKLEGEA